MSALDRKLREMQHTCSHMCRPLDEVHVAVIVIDIPASRVTRYRNITVSWWDRVLDWLGGMEAGW